MTNFVQWRAYIGPPWKMNKFDPLYFYWSILNEDGSLLPAADQITLNATMASLATVATVSSTATYPAAGWVWMGPNGSGEGWESIGYAAKTAGQFTGLTRETTANRDHNGTHTNGAIVRYWWPLESASGAMQMSFAADDGLAVISWSTDISGFNVPAVAIRNNHIIVVQRRTDPDDAYTNWLVGWLDSPRVSDDAKFHAPWSARIVSSADMIARQTVPGIRSGEFDLARHGSASASSTLGNAANERASGDYIAAAPSFDAGQVLADTPNAPWIGDRYIGTENTPISGGTGDPSMSELQITQMYINPAPGTRGGSRWIELTLTSGSNVQGLGIFAARTAGPGYKQWDFKGPGYLEIGDHILLVEDEDVFTEQNPSASPEIIYESEEFFPSLIAASGDMGIRINALNRWVHNVAWGDGTLELPNIDGGTPGHWTGPRIPAPAYGETMRYIYDPVGTPVNPVDWWEVGNVHSPGYDIDTSPDEWMQISLPGMGLKLRDDITASVPGIGGFLYIENDSGASTEGLGSTGTGQIGSEHLSWSAKTDTYLVISARNANGTTAAVHVAGDAVFVIDTDGIATDAHFIKQISINQEAGGTIYPKAFSIRVSNLPGGARTPNDGNDYNNDYTQVDVTSTNTLAVYTHTLSPSRRIKTILIKIARMTTDPARARISKITALVDPVHYNATTWIIGGTVTNVITSILGLANVPAAAIIGSGTALAPEGDSTEPGDALSVLTNYADFTGFRVKVLRDSKFSISNILGADMIDSTPTAAYGWTRTNARKVEQIYAADGGVSQVKLTWQATATNDGGVVTWPAEPHVFGTVTELGPYVYQFEADALEACKKRYYRQKYPFTVAVECVDAEPLIRPGDICSITWKFGTGDNTTMTRLFALNTVDHAINNNVWSTVFTATQIDRVEGF